MIPKSSIGYFDDKSDDPVYDPKQTAPCLICDRSWTADTVRTISVCGSNLRSYFFRVHRECADAKPELIEDIEHFIIETLP